MPEEKPGTSAKENETYEALRDDGASREKAARIANVGAGGQHPPEKGGHANDYEYRTVDELRERAAQVGIDGRSEMSRDELIEALRDR